MSDDPLLVEQTRFERPPGSEDAVITFTSHEGSSVTITLPPVAQTQLLSMLLAGPKGRVVGEHFQLTRPPVRVTSFQSFVMSDDVAGLQAEIDQGALFLAFDGAAFEQLKKSVLQLSSPSKSQPDPQSTKH